MEHVCLFPRLHILKEFSRCTQLNSLRIFAEPLVSTRGESNTWVSFCEPWVSQDEVIALELRRPESLWAHGFDGSVTIRTIDRQPVWSLNVQVIGVKERCSGLVVEQTVFELEVFNHTPSDDVDFCA